MVRVIEVGEQCFNPVKAEASLPVCKLYLLQVRKGLEVGDRFIDICDRREFFSQWILFSLKSLGKVCYRYGIAGCYEGQREKRVWTNSYLAVILSLLWRRTQVVRERSAKPLCTGSNPIGAFLFSIALSVFL